MNICQQFQIPQSGHDALARWATLPGASHVQNFKPARAHLRSLHGRHVDTTPVNFHPRFPPFKLHLLDSMEMLVRLLRKGESLPAKGFTIFPEILMDGRLLDVLCMELGGLVTKGDLVKDFLRFDPNAEGTVTIDDLRRVLGRFRPRSPPLISLEHTILSRCGIDGGVTTVRYGYRIYDGYMSGKDVQQHMEERIGGSGDKGTLVCPCIMFVDYAAAGKSGACPLMMTLGFFSNKILSHGNEVSSH